MKENITISDIAKIANVSSKTVSKVINNQSGVKLETREKILKIMKENNYSINYNARRLSEAKSRQIALVTNISKKHPLNKNYLIMQHILEIIKDYEVVIYNKVEDLQTNPYGGIAKSYYDGIILLNPSKNESIEYIKESNIPFVVSGSFQNCSFVGTDQIQSGYIATKHLLELGCKDIVFLLNTKKSFTAEKKIEGYLKALKEFNVEFVEENIKDEFYTVESVEEFIKSKYYMKKMPDAIMIDSDFPAFGAIRAFSKLNIKCPEDIKIITFGNTYICPAITPSLSSIKQNFELIAHKLVEILLEKINKNNDEEKSYIIPAELIVRESTIKI